MKSLFICLILVAATNCVAQNVGIGTTTPKVKLHVVKGASLVDPYAGSTMAIQTDGETMLHILSGGNGESGSIIFGNNQQPVSTGIQFNTFTPNDLSFFTNASFPTFTVNNLGNIGIHTVGPKAAFNVGAGKTVLFGADSSGPGGKMIWYPSKYAFRAGLVHSSNPGYWDYNNIGVGSFAVGVSNSATAYCSSSFGSNNEATSDFSTAFGFGNYVSGGTSTAIGGFNHVGNGGFSAAIGYQNLVSGNTSTAIGGNSVTSGDYSSSMGNGLLAKSAAEIVVGSYNTNYTPASSTVWSATDRLFVVGNGTTSGTRSDAIVVLKNGNTGIGESNPAFPLNFYGSLGDKISLFGNVANGSCIGFGIQSGLLQIHSYQESDDIAFGYGSSSNFAEQMRIKGNGNIGIGTTNPNAPLQFANTLVNRKIVLWETANNDHQFSGFGANSNVVRYQSDNANADHVFYSAINSTSSKELVRIKGTGNVGIGTNNPGYKLDVAGTINASELRVNGALISSDARFKQNISTLPNALNNLLQLRGTNYFFNTNAFPDKNFSADKQIGVIAQEVEKVFPELVSTGKDGYKSVNYIGLVPVMIESIKEQQTQIEKQNQQIEKLTRLVNQLLNK